MWNDDRVKAFVDCQCAIHWLRVGFDKSGCGVGIAGSFALLYYMRIVLDLRPTWRPSDCDVYVFGCDEDVFRDKVKAFALYLRSYRVKFACGIMRENAYSATASVRLVVWDVIIGEKNFRLSFIHHPTAETMADVIADYDINVVKVHLDPFDNVFRLSDSVREAIIAGKAEVRDFMFDDVVPTSAEVYLLAATLHRMRKYEERGFVFARTPVIGSIAGETDVMSE